MRRHPIRREESSPRWPWAERRCFRPPRTSSATLRPIPPGIKIGTSAGQPTEENMLYLKQLGVTWVSLGASPETATAEGFIKMREQWEAGGFKVYNIGSGVGPERQPA